MTVRTGNSASIKKAGTVILTGYAPGTNNMFGATPITKFVTVSKAPLTVTGDDFSIITGAGLPNSLTYVATGWKNGDNEASSLSTGISVTTMQRTPTLQELSTFARAELFPDKYLPTYVDGQLIITSKTTQSITEPRLLKRRDQPNHRFEREAPVPTFR